MTFEQLKERAPEDMYIHIIIPIEGEDEAKVVWEGLAKDIPDCYYQFKVKCDGEPLNDTMKKVNRHFYAAIGL